ncbi:ERCC4 domain-containing protein [Bacteroides sp.]|uniref:ERCC4 domain-containing protein n=1 Tax=Bacteroides sp. TaxID=29523 RepID=UPI00260701C6|nr:ERCC4 domain-containing protein [Bacteroides sp.]MDD3039607.1 ERCC4 domain-containing protein [Bacteroides sp.]
MITIDTREQKPWSLTDAWSGVSFTVATLSTGDYSNGNVIIERKSIPDICNCCGKSKQRFWNELARGFDYLIIEGDEQDITAHLKKRHSRMSQKYILKCLHEIRDNFGVEVILAGSREDAARIALEILGGTYAAKVN